MIRHRRPADPDARLRAVHSVIADPADQTSVLPLVQAVEDPSLDVARAALRRLATLAGPTETAMLRHRLLDLDIGLVGDVAATLVKLSDRDAVDVVVAGLRFGSPMRRHKAALAARELRAPSARHALLQALADVTTPVRRVALEALSRLPPDAQTVSAARRCLRDRDAAVRSAAIGAVAALDRDAAQTLATLVVDAEPRVRTALAAAAANLDADTIITLLGDEEPGVRQQTLRTLSRKPRPGVGRSLNHALTDANWHVRRAACDAIAAARTPNAASVLITALIDSHPAVRGRALVALEQLLGPQLDPTLEQALDEAPPQLRRTLIEILGHHQRTAAVLRFAADPAVLVRLAVVHALSGEPSDEARTALDRLRYDHDRSVRHAAAGSIARVRARAGRGSPRADPRGSG